MARRPVLRKRAHKLRKALRSELPASLDLVQFLKLRGYASTTGEAEKIILAGRVVSESHKLGIKEVTRPKKMSQAQIVAGQAPEPETVDVVDRMVSAKLRDTIEVRPA
jgi:hypothetical protein